MSDVPHVFFLESIRNAAEQAIADHRGVAYWKKEAEYWKKQYDELLQSNIKHSEEMVGGIMMLALQGIKP